MGQPTLQTGGVGWKKQEKRGRAGAKPGKDTGDGVVNGCME